MHLHKIRVDLYGEMGEKYTITFQGRITRDKSLRLLDLVELLGDMREFTDNPTWAKGKKKTKFDRVRMIVQKIFPTLLVLV